jgi:hypothetical protein
MALINASLDAQSADAVVVVAAVVALLPRTPLSLCVVAMRSSTPFAITP